jgi:hypothetical protein
VLIFFKLFCVLRSWPIKIWSRACFPLKKFRSAGQGSGLPPLKYLTTPLRVRRGEWKGDCLHLTGGDRRPWFGLTHLDRKLSSIWK